MHKEFLPYDTIRNDGFRLARKIWEDGFIPDVIYVSLRGGSSLGNAIHGLNWRARIVSLCCMLPLSLIPTRIFISRQK